jgi:hypothetical protein
VCLEVLEDRIAPDNSLGTAITLNVPTDSQTISSLSAAEFFSLTVQQPGRLTATVHSTGFATRLSLLRDDGALLTQSDGQSASTPDDRIVQDLLGTSMMTTYFLQVEALDGGTGSFTLTTQFTPASLDVGLGPTAVVAANFNHDGPTDLVVTSKTFGDVSILLGLGDGSFQKAVSYSLGADSLPDAVVSGDFNGDGLPDLAVADYQARDVAILLNNKADPGTFPMPTRYPLAVAPTALVAEHLVPNGSLDLAVAGTDSLSGQGDVMVLQGRGDGTFEDPVTVARYSDPSTNATPAYPIGIVAGDFNGDDHPDLAVVDNQIGLVDSFENPGTTTFADNSFQPFMSSPIVFGITAVPSALVTKDFDGDGKLDLAVANQNMGGAGTVVILHGDGDGTFQVGDQYPVGGAPAGLLTTDFNGDGRPDLATVNNGSDSVSVLLGNSDGTFQPELHFAVGASPTALVEADFNGDQNPDLAVTSGSLSNLSLLLGVGDGSFRLPAAAPVFVAGTQPSAVVTGDLDRDGTQDVVVLNNVSRSVSVLLGNGDGTFQPQQTFAVGDASVAAVLGDFNGDGRLDLAVADAGSDQLSILLGNGNGTFQSATTIALGATPLSIVTGDFDGDGHLDLAVADRVAVDSTNNTFTDGVSILLGDGRGGFHPESNRLVLGDAVAVQPNLQREGVSLTAKDLDGNGTLDLAVASGDFDNVSVFRGDGHGSFNLQQTFTVGMDPLAIVAGDFTGDGIVDLATANAGDSTVSVLCGLGGGIFAPVAMSLTVGVHPRSIVAGDFNGDHRLDLATANAFSNSVSILLSQGGMRFQDQRLIPVGDGPVSLTATDFNGDGHTDLVTADAFSVGGTVLLGLGDGNFVPSRAAANPLRSTPLFGDVNGDGATDSVIIDRAGNILFRAGRPTEPGSFDAPIVVNPGFHARDVALVAAHGRDVIAALDAQGDEIVLFDAVPGGGFAAQSVVLATGRLPTRIVSADLNGDGLGDLVVLNAGDATLSVFLQNLDGGFTKHLVIPAGVVGASDLTLTDVDGDGRPDILVAGLVSGDVAVLHNRSDGTFDAPLRFRAATGLYGVDTTSGSLDITSDEGTTGVVIADLNHDGRADLIAANQHGLTLLPARRPSSPPPAGSYPVSFLNPQDLLPGIEPSSVVEGDFNGDGNPDLAVLSGSQLRVFLGSSAGVFQERFPALPAGIAPTGLTARDLTSPTGGGPDGKLDLVVGDALGDILIFAGNGDGTFQTFQTIDRKVSLALSDSGDGRTTFAFANKANNHVSAQNTAGIQSFLQDAANGLLAPSAVKLIDLNGDGIPDLIAANTGGNDVIVYQGLGNGLFGIPQTFFAGTSPVSLAVGDLTGDGIPDIAVANEGSNDVSVLKGQVVNGQWTSTEGLRLQAGRGPASVTIADVAQINNGVRTMTPDGTPDLLVANSLDNTVSVLPGVGGGFFNDQLPAIQIPGMTPMMVMPIETAAGRGLVTVNQGSDDLTVIPDLRNPEIAVEIFSGGEHPVAAVAADFNHDGFTDVVVVNNGDGVVELLNGTATGFNLGGLFSSSDLLHPTDIAFDAARNILFAAAEGSETAVPIFLTSLGITVSDPHLLSNLSSTSGSAGTGALFVSGPGFSAAVSLPVLVNEGSDVVGEGGGGGDDAGAPPARPDGIAGLSSDTGTEGVLTFTVPDAGPRPPGWTLGTDPEEDPRDLRDEVFQDGLWRSLEAAPENGWPSPHRQGVARSLTPTDFLRTDFFSPAPLRWDGYHELLLIPAAPTEANDPSYFPQEANDTVAGPGASSGECPSVFEAECAIPRPRVEEPSHVPLPILAEQQQRSMSESLALGLWAVLARPCLVNPHHRMRKIMAKVIIPK